MPANPFVEIPKNKQPLTAPELHALIDRAGWRVHLTTSAAPYLVGVDPGARKVMVPSAATGRALNAAFALGLAMIFSGIKQRKAISKDVLNDPSAFVGNDDFNLALGMLIPEKQRVLLKSMGVADWLRQDNEIIMVPVEWANHAYRAPIPESTPVPVLDSVANFAPSIATTP